MSPDEDVPLCAYHAFLVTFSNSASEVVVNRNL